MTWTVVARKEFRDAVRSKTLWALSALFVLFMAGFAYLYTLVLDSASAQGNADVTLFGLIGFVSSAVLLLLPLIGLIVGYKAVVGEVESGKAKLLLSLPHSRRDVVVGKAVGRTGVLSVTVLVGFVAAILVVLGFYDTFAPVDYALFALLTIVLGAMFVCIGVGISALTKSTGVATAGMVGVFVVFQFLWNFIPIAINYVLNGTFGMAADSPVWQQAILALRPQNAYSEVLTTSLDDVSFPVNPGDSVFTSVEFAAVVLALWIVGPLLVGYLRFRAADL